MCGSELLVNYKKFSKAIYKIFSSGYDIVIEFSKDGARNKCGRLYEEF
jgi:hypothetical protein